MTRGKKTTITTRIARIGEYVEFTRKDTLIYGRVLAVNENTVMVEFHDAFARQLDLSNNLTVVNHKHYTIAKKDSFLLSLQTNELLIR